MKPEEKRVSYRQAWRRTLRAWRVWWKLCPGYFVSCALSAVFKALQAYAGIYFSARIIGELAGGRDPRQLAFWVALQLGSAAGIALASGLLTRWASYEKGCADRLYCRIYMDKMLSLDYAEMDRQSVHDLFAQIQQNDGWSSWGMRRARRNFEELLRHGTLLLGGVALSVSLFLSRVPGESSLAFLNHPLLSAGVAGLLVVVAVASPLCGNRAQRFWSRYASDARLGNRMFSFYGFMCHDHRVRAADLRMYNQQEQVCDVSMARNQMFGVASQIARYARGPMGGLYALGEALSMGLTGLAYLFVCLKAWAGAFGVGEITQYVGAMTQLFAGVTGLLRVFGEVRSNADFLETCFTFLDLPNPMYQGSLTTEKRSDRQYLVEFRDVSFRYPGSERWALRHVNIQFRVGSRLAVVGVNGSGKTTFIKLLCRLYDPTEGEILLNGIDIRKYRYEDYMELFSVVFQDFKLLALPLGENVAGASVYDRALARRCLEDAGFGERLNAMPQGLDTSLYRELDPQGVEISGGEAQKIAIARALFKDAPFIVLDEPTAALDPVAEAEIYSKFDAIAGDKTAIYISHRLSSCKFCDEIAVFDHGSIVQQGTHAALLTEKDGVYHALWHAQAQYYTT